MTSFGTFWAGSLIGSHVAFTVDVVLFFQHIALELDKCLFLPPYGLAPGTSAGAF